MQVEIFSDIACPWCYIGKRRFQAALAEYEHADAVTVVWRSFELDPGAQTRDTGLTVDKLMGTYGIDRDDALAMLARAAREAATVGLTFRLEEARSANTFDAHRLTHFAAEVGDQDVVIEALMRAVQVEGAFVGDHETLVDIASSVGLEADAVRAVLTGDAYADRVKRDELRARRIGVTGVPFFVFDERSGISGAQPSDYFLQALRQLGPQRTEPAGAQ